MNINKKKLKKCSIKPLTGYYRDGYCKTGPDDKGTHTVCATMNEKFLKYSKKKGNDLVTPSYYFPGLKSGDKWCLCEYRWNQAYLKDPKLAPFVNTGSTNIKTRPEIVKNIKKKNKLKSKKKKMKKKESNSKRRTSKKKR